MSSESLYMMQRSLMLLLSDVRPGRQNSGNSLHFLPEFGREESVQGPRLLPLLLLINLWTALSGLHRRILPKLVVPFKWSQGGGTVTDSVVGGYVDWGATFQRWSDGETGYVIRNLRRGTEERHAEYVAFVLGEILVHTKVICEAVERYSKKAAPPPIARMISDIVRIGEEVQKVLDSDFGHFLPSARGLLRRAEKYLATIIWESGEILTGLGDYSARLRVPSPGGSFATTALESLVNWRAQYLQCSVWLGGGKVFDIDQRHGTDRLYEMWCFVELCIAMRRMGLGDTLQRTFIAQRRPGPVFALGGGRYVFFDYRGRRFLPPNRSGRELLQKSGFLAPALVGTHVEWLILDPERREDSVIIDTKYSAWNSREALKVMGYMMDFGVRKGVIVFAELQDWSYVGGKKVVEGLQRIECKGPGQPCLWIMSLVPKSKNEEQNSKILDRLVREVL